MEESFIAVPVPDRRDPPGATTPTQTRLQAVFTAENASVRARGLRGALVGLLAVLGVPMWVALIWPGSVSRNGRALVETLWILALGGVLLAMVGEAWWRRQRSRHIAKLGPLPVMRPHAAEGQACATFADEED